MRWLFFAGLLMDMFFSRRLGQTSALLLLAAGLWQGLKKFWPRKVSREIKLK